MFHRERDASKVALVALVDLLTADGVRGRLRPSRCSLSSVAARRATTSGRAS